LQPEYAVDRSGTGLAEAPLHSWFGTFIVTVLAVLAVLLATGVHWAGGRVLKRTVAPYSS